MTNQIENHSQNESENNLYEEMSLSEVTSIILKKKLFVGIITLLISILAMIAAFTLPNIYESESILSPTGEKNRLSPLQSYSGLASLAGINLSGADGSDLHTKALEKLKSLSFFSENILPNINLPDLMAIKFWDSKNNKIIYNLNEYNKKPPTAQEAYKSFQKIIKITNNTEKGFVNIAVSHQSPHIAKAWNELIVKELNDYFRNKDRLEAQAAVNFLNSQLSLATFSEVKQAIAEILKQKTQQLTLIEVNEYYVFEFIDPPVVMEIEAEPNRPMIIILGFIIGIFLGSFFVLMMHYSRSKKQ